MNVPVNGLVHERDRHETDIRADYADQVSHVLISSTYIRRRVAELAREVIQDARAAGAPQFQFVVALKGATVFANALAQAIYWAGGPPVRFNYVRASSYGSGLASSGHVRIEGQLPYVRGRPVMVVEDIVDTGLTMQELKRYLLEERDASAVKTCTLLNKPSRRSENLKQTMEVNYIGFTIPNLFVAGYGIDCDEHLRELPFIVAVREEYFAQPSKKREEE